MSNIWFTSDSHYFHRNIAGPKVSQWKNGYRNFEDEKEMSRHIVKTFNQCVEEDDTLYHLGDWSFGGIENIWNFRKQLRCKNIILVLGNHDSHIKNNKNIPPEQFKEFKHSSFDAWRGLDSGSAGLKCLFSEVHSDLIIENLNGYTFHLNHYAKRIWYASNKGSIHLFGHSHGSMPMYGKSMDVGIDVAYKIFSEYRPFKFEEIINIMSKRNIEFPDHHNEKTN